MIEQDTVRLLRECDAGIKMGVSSINDVLDNVHAKPLYQCLAENRTEHEALQRKLQSMLERCDDDGKEPNPMAKGMSWIKANVKLAMEESDATVADLITDGCNMGVKSLNRYLNQYKAADEPSKALARQLIELEERLARELRPYL